MEGPDVSPVRVEEAVILMAGVGSRLGKAGGAVAKPLVQVGGRSLISYTLDAFERIGVRTIHAVMGANHESLTDAITPLVPATIQFHPILNSEWTKQNGVSVLTAAATVREPFFLVMGDHLFEFAVLESLLSAPKPALLNLAVDRKIASIFDLDDAMKVQTKGDLIIAIAKDLREYDAIDTGVFLCSPELFNYLKRSQQDGDCSLADGVRLMAAEQKARAIDIGDAWWQDVDTPEMLARAERESACLLRKRRSGLAQERAAGQQSAGS